jgi:adenine-specific DNA-methyltransferase
MATGVTKNKWNESTQIITKFHYGDKDIGYHLSYKGKVDKKEVIIHPTVSEYLRIDREEVTNNKLFYGDNLDVLRYLLKDQSVAKKVKLIYIDPPYATNSIFHNRLNEHSYKDDLIGAHYLEFMRQRLIVARELLSDDGSIYVHLDNNMIFQIKIILDEIFGSKNYRGLITRKKCSNKNSTRNTYGNISDYILFYSKGTKFVWNRPESPWTDDKIKKEYNNIDPITGRRYKKVPIHAPGVRNGETGREWKGMLPPAGKHWQFTPAKLDELDAKGDIYWSENGNPRRKVYLDESNGIAVQDIWLDVQDSLNQSIKITGYPTEKNAELLKRIINASSNPGDLVLDFFAGSGTTLGVASHLDRYWIGIDNSFESINHIFKRFFRGVNEMGDFVKKQRLMIPSILEEMPIGLSNTRLTNFNFLSDKDYQQDADKILSYWLK